MSCFFPNFVAQIPRILALSIKMEKKDVIVFLHES